MKHLKKYSQIFESEKDDSSGRYILVEIRYGWPDEIELVRFGGDSELYVKMVVDLNSPAIDGWMDLGEGTGTGYAYEYIDVMRSGLLENFGDAPYTKDQLESTIDAIENWFEMESRGDKAAIVLMDWVEDVFPEEKLEGGLYELFGVMAKLQENIKGGIYELIMDKGKDFDQAFYEVLSKNWWSMEGERKKAIASIFPIKWERI